VGWLVLGLLVFISGTYSSFNLVKYCIRKVMATMQDTFNEII